MVDLVKSFRSIQITYIWSWIMQNAAFYQAQVPWAYGRNRMKFCGFFLNEKYVKHIIINMSMYCRGAWTWQSPLRSIKSAFLYCKKMEKNPTKTICGILCHEGNPLVLQPWTLQPSMIIHVFHPQDTDPLGAILLNMYTVTKASDVSRPHCFKLSKYDARTYYFQAKDEGEMALWAEKIRSATDKENVVRRAAAGCVTFYHFPPHFSSSKENKQSLASETLDGTIFSPLFLRFFQGS